jgi:predicted chitinase
MAKRRTELRNKEATYPPRPVPGEIKREIENIDAEVGRQNEYIASKRKESATIAARYDADKQRFRELRASAQSGAVVTTDDGRYARGQGALQLTGTR